MVINRSPGVEFVPDPIRYLQGLAESHRVKVWRFAVDRHYGYQAMDQSGTTGDVRVRPCFDSKPECETCRPFVIEKESDRILAAFGHEAAYISVVGGSDRDRVRRLAGDLGCSYVFVPCGPGVVLSTASMSEFSVELFDLKHVLSVLVMVVRWKDQISNSRGFLPPARKPGFWEAHHPSTIRRCFHAHKTREEARQCAVQTGEALDGSSNGWYTRRASEWRILGVLRPDIRKRQEENARAVHPKPKAELVFEELREIAHRSGIQIAERPNARGNLVFTPVSWGDPRFVEFRRLARWKQPGKAGARWQPPIYPIAFVVDDRGRATGAS